jgi:lysophospholipase L1-like esterase
VTVIAGDSLAVGMSSVWGSEHEFTGRVGARSAEVLPDLLELLARVDPAVVVVSLGTNDAPDPVTATETVRAVLAATDAPVVWTTVHRSAAYAPVNEALRALDRRSAQLRVADWDRVVSSRPELLARDGVHPVSGAGYQVMVDTVREAL